MKYRMMTAFGLVCVAALANGLFAASHGATVSAAFNGLLAILNFIGLLIWVNQ